MRRVNGSVIGPKVQTSAINAVGIWSMGEMALLQVSGNWPTETYIIDILAVGAGGGAGGFDGPVAGAGGGAGGAVYGTMVVSKSQTLSVVAGGGGGAGASSTTGGGGSAGANGGGSGGNAGGTGSSGAGGGEIGRAHV